MTGMLQTGMNKTTIFDLNISLTSKGITKRVWEKWRVAEPIRACSAHAQRAVARGDAHGCTNDTTRSLGEVRMRFHRTLYAVSAGLALGAFCAAAIGDEVAERAKDSNLWAAPGGDQSLSRHSALKTISASNVGGLQMIWSQSSGTLRGHEGQPLVVTVNGKPMMFMESGWPNIIQALDLSDADHPKEMWNYKKTTNRDDSAVPRACCDTVNRGPSFADGKVVFGTLDGFVIALDAATGKEVWVVKSAFPDKGETITPAPRAHRRRSL